MDHSEKRRFLIDYLLNERPELMSAEVPADVIGQKRLLRSLFNIRPPMKSDDRFIEIQNEYLREAAEEKGITDISELTEAENGIYLWQGDITALRCDAIVNAANSGMTGCYSPCHGCIDNAIHTYSGVQLRNACNDIMLKQGTPEPTGMAKLTSGYNLPCKYVLHTVGPIVEGRLTDKECDLLRSCYLSCLELAEKNGIKSIAFCCISTGVFGFPKKEAAEIAVNTVREYRNNGNNDIKVIFNVFTDEDLIIYQKLLGIH